MNQKFNKHLLKYLLDLHLFQVDFIFIYIYFIFLIYLEDPDHSDKTKHSTSDDEDSSDSTLREKSTNKTWQIIFHISNIPKEKNIVVKFSLIANDEDDETETYRINIKQSTSDKRYSFTVKDIGKPERIRLKIYNTDDDDDDNDNDIKLYLDHVRKILKYI